MRTKKFFFKLTLFLLPFFLWQVTELFILPMDFFAFRPWDVLVVNQLPGHLMGPFLPNQSLTKLEMGYQDYVCKYPNAQPKRTTWMVDRHGQRNLNRDVESYEVLLSGDSNIAGSYLDQKDTLSEVLEKLCGKPVYNTTGTLLWFDDDRSMRHPPKFLVSNFYPDIYPQNACSWRFVFDGWRVREKTIWPKRLLVYVERFLKQPSREFLRARLKLTEIASRAGSLSGARRINDLVAKMSDEEALAQLEKQAVSMAQCYAKLGTEVIYLFMPAPVDRYQKYVGLIANLRKQGIKLVYFDPTPEYPNGYPDDFWQKADSHWTEKAVKATAQKILEQMQAPPSPIMQESLAGK